MSSPVIETDIVGRGYYYKENLKAYDGKKAALVPEKRMANLIGSELAYMPELHLHSPVLDIDFPARLIPSSTEGHFHLYLDGVEVEWEKYKKVLDALADAGIIQEGYAKASIDQGQSYVRLPSIKKGDDRPDSQKVSLRELVLNET